jgi:hypothetical protein
VIRKAGWVVDGFGNVGEVDCTVGAYDAKTSLAELQVAGAGLKQMARGELGLLDNVVCRETQRVPADDSAARRICSTPERDLVSVALN